MALRSELERVTRFADVPMEIEIELDRRTMRLSDILKFAVGGVVPFAKTAGDYLDIFVGGVRVGRGEVVVLEKNVGVRITGFETRT
jgi:flagellar motor switch protein FliN/FliY